MAGAKFTSSLGLGPVMARKYACLFLMLCCFVVDVVGFVGPSALVILGRSHAKFSETISTQNRKTLNRNLPLRKATRSSQGLRMAGSDVTDLTFKKEILESKVLTIVSFWAPWCGPCRMIKPVLDEIEFDYRGKVKIALVNTDENQQTAVEYGIRSIPTLILFKDGVRLETIIGAVPKATLEAKLAQNL